MGFSCLIGFVLNENNVSEIKFLILIMMQKNLTKITHSRTIPLLEAKKHVYLTVDIYNNIICYIEINQLTSMYIQLYTL